MTGASRGIGRHLAVRLGEMGARLSLAARDADAIRDIAIEIGPAVRAIPADISDAAARRKLLSEAQDAHGPVDVLVNNAGVEYAAFFAEQCEAEIRETIQANLLAAMLLTRGVLGAMVERRSGHILNVASLAGLAASPYEAAYSASKFGLVGFSQALRAELRGTGVSCSVVCPGFVADDGMYARLAAKGVTSPRALGVSGMDVVVDRIANTIVNDRAVTIVNPVPVRPLLAVQALLPGTHSSAVRLLGVTELFRRAATTRRSSRD